MFYPDDYRTITGRLNEWEYYEKTISKIHDNGDFVGRSFDDAGEYVFCGAEHIRVRGRDGLSRNAKKMINMGLTRKGMIVFAVLFSICYLSLSSFSTVSSDNFQVISLVPEGISSAETKVLSFGSPSGCHRSDTGSLVSLPRKGSGRGGPGSSQVRP